MQAQTASGKKVLVAYFSHSGNTREMARQIAEACGLPLEFEDERLSSQEAKRILREEGYNEKSMRGRVDMVAASLFLQTWLDAQRG